MNNPKVDTAIDNINKGYKVMILLRGAPGSGKSTIARYIVDQTVKGDYRNFIFSTDDYFYNVNDQYVYQPERLSDAHDFNQRRCRQKAAAGWSPIIIDNTNTKVWEMSPYVDIAGQYTYKLEIIEPKNSWYRSAEKLAMKNRHSVPKDKIQRMLDQYEKINVPQLLQVNNISCKMLIPQFRRNPPLPFNLNAKRLAPSKENIDKNITGSKENFKKFNNVKQSDSKGKVNNLLQTEKNNRQIQVEQPKPQSRGPRKPVKSTAPLVRLEEQSNRLSQLDEPRHCRRPRCDEERLHIRNMPTDKLIQNTVYVPKSQRQMSTTSAAISNTRLNQPKNADKKIYSIVKNYPKNETQLNPAAAFQDFIPHLRKPKLGYAKESKSSQLQGQRYPNKQVEDLQALFEKCNFHDNK